MTHPTVRKNQKIFHPCCDKYGQSSYCYEYDWSYLVAADFITLFVQHLSGCSWPLHVFVCEDGDTLNISLFVVHCLVRLVRVWDADTNDLIPIVGMSLTRILMVKVVSLLARDAWTM